MAPLPPSPTGPLLINTAINTSCTITNYVHLGVNIFREAVGTAMMKEDVPLEDALPFEQIPGPRPLPVIGTLYKYLPGGEYHQKYLPGGEYHQTVQISTLGYDSIFRRV